MVQRLLTSKRYLVSRSSARRLGMQRPQYSMMKVPFLIGSVANRPRPVLERPIRKGFAARLRLGPGLRRGCVDDMIAVGPLDDGAALDVCERRSGRHRIA